MFTDLLGIEIEDHVLIGPNVPLVSVEHPLEPKEHRGVCLKPVLIKQNAWLGANATILS